MMFGLVRRRRIYQTLAAIQRAADELEIGEPDAERFQDLAGHNGLLAVVRRAEMVGMARGLRVAAASITDKLDGISP